jgi:hypothetical protein
MKDTIISPDDETSVGGCVTVCVMGIVVLTGTGISSCEGIGVVGVSVVSFDGALHPENKRSRITKKAKIGRVFILVNSFSEMIKMISCFLSAPSL